MLSHSNTSCRLRTRHNMHKTEESYFTSSTRNSCLFSTSFGLSKNVASVYECFNWQGSWKTNKQTNKQKNAKNFRVDLLLLYEELMELI